MRDHLRVRRVVSALLSALMIVTLIAPLALPVNAANRRFITELRVEAGAEAIDKLEKDGWSVLRVGLNVTPDPESQVYLAYKTNTGKPITNVIVSPDVGSVARARAFAARFRAIRRHSRRTRGEHRSHHFHVFVSW